MIDPTVHFISDTEPKKHDNAIVFAVDEGFLPFAFFAAKKITQLEPKRDFDVVICLPPDANIPSHLLNAGVRFVHWSIKGLDGLPTGRLTLAAYHRIFLPELFYSEYIKILYLDADCYPCRPFFSELLESNKEAIISMAPDCMEIKRRCTGHVGLDIEKMKNMSNYYRNSGVAFFDVKKFIDSGLYKDVFSYMEKNFSTLKCHDQSVLNFSLEGRISMLNYEYNWQYVPWVQGVFSSFDQAIIHFVGYTKPWLRGADGASKKYTKEYTEFLSNYFPDYKPALSKESIQWRLENPKYKGVKESVSVIWLRTKKSAINRFIKQKFNVFANIKTAKEIRLSKEYKIK